MSRLWKRRTRSTGPPGSDRATRELGIADRKLLENGTLARGSVVSCESDGITVGNDAHLAYGPEKVCRVVVEVSGLDGVEPYQATCKHAIPTLPARWAHGPGLPTDMSLVIPDWAAIAA
jgi:hypothetical protein